MIELSTLVCAAQQGDQAAFGQIVQRFQDMAYASAYAMLGDSGLAQDAAQEAFVDAYLSLPKLREPAAFPGWFRRVIVKHADRQIRSAPPTAISLESLEMGWELRSPLPEPEAWIETIQMQDQVQDAIRLLPEGQRMATTLFYVEGYSHKEIADFLDLPVTTIKKRLFDARRFLKERMVDMVQEILQANKPSQNDTFATKVAFFVALKANDMRQIQKLITQHPELIEATTEREVVPSGYYWPVGMTALHWAAGTGNQALVKFLLAHGAAINAQSKKVKPTALYEAVHMHQPDMVALLIQEGADVNLPAYSGQTPLHAAIHKNSVESARLLLDAGANLHASDEQGRTPMDWAIHYQSSELVTLLQEQGATPPNGERQRAVNTHTSPNKRRQIPVGPSIMGRVLDAAGKPIDGGAALSPATFAAIERPFGTTTPMIHTTGIKIIDLFSPLKRGGQNGLFTPLTGVGKVVVMSQMIYSTAKLHNGYTIYLGLDNEEFSGSNLMLCWRDFGGDHRLMSQRVVNLFATHSDSLTKKQQLAETGLTMAEHLRRQGHEVLLMVDSALGQCEGVFAYLKGNTAATPDAAITTLYCGSHTIGSEPEPYTQLDSVLGFDLWRAQQGLWPSLDPIRSHSAWMRAETLGQAHVQLIAEAQRLLRREESVRSVIEKSGVEGVATLGDPTLEQDVQRARRLQRFLTQPLPGVEPFTGQPGVHVSLADALAGAQKIVNGDYDGLPEEAFRFVGMIEQVIEKAKKM